MSKKSKKTNEELGENEAQPINYPTEHEVIDAKRKESISLELQYSEEQIGEKGKQLAKALQEYAGIELDKKMEVDKFKSLLDAKNAEIEVLTEQISTGFEMQTVSCEVKRNFTTGMREYWKDGSKLKEEPLRASDHQLELNTEGELSTNVVRMFKIKAGDYVVTSKGSVVEITSEDVINGIQYEGIERLATEEEIVKYKGI